MDRGPPFLEALATSWGLTTESGPVSLVFEMMPVQKAIKKSSSDSFLSETCDTIEEAPKPMAAMASRPPKKTPVRSMSMACLSEIGQEQTPQQPASAKIKQWKEAVSQRFNVKWERLPAHSPYVGSFHRGFSVEAKGPNRTYDLDRERLSEHCPYVGTFHRGHSASVRQSPNVARNEDSQSRMETVPSIDELMSFSTNKGSTGDRVANFNTNRPSPPRKGNTSSSMSASASPKPAPAPKHVGIPQRDGPDNNKDSSSSTSGSPPEDSREALRTDSRASGAMTPVASLNPPSRVTSIKSNDSFASIHSLKWGFDDDDEMLDQDPDSPPSREGLRSQILLPTTVPHSAELCGLQSILPRQSGVRVLDKIGEGTFAKVVLAVNHRNPARFDHSREAKGFSREIAVHPKEGDKIVLKCIKKDITMGEEGLACIRREVQIHQRMSHPHIPTMYGFYEDEQRVTLILGFVEGRELHAALKAKRVFGEVETKVISSQVLSALVYLHMLGIVHRDVTPRNILVAASGRATLIDLGLAINIQDAKLVPPAAGTMGYISPEQYGSNTISPAVDVWAMGCIMYEMLHAFSPFMPHEVMSPTVTVQFLEDESWGIVVGSDCRALLEGMLCKEVKSRISSIEAAAHAWYGAETAAAVDRIIEQDAAYAAAQGEGGDACGQPDGETRICGDTQMGDEAGGACAAADAGSGGGVGSGTSISSAGCVGGGASGDACIAAVGGGVGGKEGEAGVDPYCIRMEGVGHPSPDNDHNYIVYARVVGMEGVKEEDEGMESGDVMDPAEEWHTQGVMADAESDGMDMDPPCSPIGGSRRLPLTAHRTLKGR